MYREGGPVDASLPWSRTAMKPLSTALVGVAIIAVAIPYLALSTLSAVDPLTTGRTATSVGFIVLLFESLAVPIALATVGAMLVRGRRILLGPLLALALFPFATGLGFALLDYRTLASADPLDTARAVTLYGRAEATTLYGASASTGACLVLAFAMAATIANVDRKRLDVLPRPPWTVLSVGSAWFVLAFAVRASNGSAFATPLFLAMSLVAPIVATALAANITWCSGIFGRTEDEKERRAAFAAIFIAALASGGFVLLLDRSAAAALTWNTLDAGDPRGDGAGLLVLAAARSTQLVAFAVDIVGCAAVFGVALRSAWTAVPTADRRRDMLRSRGLLVAGSSVLLASLLVVVVSLSSAAARAWYARASTEAWGAPGDLELPSVRSDVKKRPFPEGQLLTLHVDGRVGKLDTSGNASATNVYVDRRATFGTFAESVRIGRLPPRLALIGRREHLSESREALGDLVAFLPPPEHASPVTVRIGSTSGASAILAVLDEAPAARVSWHGRERIVSLGGDEDAVARKASFDEVVGGDSTGLSIRVLPRSTDTMDRVVAIVQALEGLDVELGVETPTSSGRGTGGSASSPRRR